MTAGDVLAWLAWSVTLAGALLLCGAAVGHVRELAMLRAVLAAQGLLPAAVRGPLSVLLGPVELALGLAVAITWALDLGPAAQAAALALAGLTTAFALYLATLLRRRPGAPCGCFGGAAVSPIAVARAGLLAVGALAAAVIPVPGPEVLTAASAVLVAGMLWLGPQLSPSSASRSPAR